ncbi:helicase HerA domain-containing protein [Staphylococcus simulans]|uniref:helicase HerA domain-containing protein n=1 Tax=Staphylococcus simulans TaxID=1286 RepID=UPI003F7EEA1A
MSSQYYNFLSGKLVEFLEHSTLNEGDRYYLILNSEKEIEKLQNAIINSESNKIETFQSEEFQFTTESIDVQGLNAIFVFAKQGVKNDFLVTIRNKVSLQEKEWKNSIVIFVINEDLDSITGGAFDLAKQGAPFHTRTLRNNLKKQVENTQNNLKDHEKIIMNFVIENTFDDELVKYTLMDFEAVFSIIEQGSINKENYHQLGLFEDKQIDTFADKEIQTRLETNKTLFDDVNYYHDRGNPRESLEENFDRDSVVNELAKDDWYEMDFETVKNSKEAMDKLKKVDMDYLEEDFLKQFKNIEVWDKPKGKTRVQRRERSIIIFRKNSTIERIKLPFSNNIKIDTNSIIKRGQKLFNLTNNSKIEIEMKGNKNNIIINTANLNDNDDYYLEFSYKHKNNTSLTFKFRILIVNFESHLIEKLRTNYTLKYDTKTKMVEVSVKDVENELVLNDSEFKEAVVKENGQAFNVDYTNVFKFNELISEDETNIYIQLLINNVFYKVKLNEVTQKPVPVSGSFLMKELYNKKISMENEKGKVIQGNSEYYPFAAFKKMLNIEEEMINNGFMYGILTSESFYGERLDLKPEIIEAYDNLVEEIKKRNSLPSLVYLDNELLESAEKYCSLFENELDELRDNEKIVDIQTQNIHKVGMIKGNDLLYLTPLHPLVLRYEIQKSKAIQDNKLPEKIIKKYNPAGLLPYFVDEEHYYFSNNEDDYPRGIIYKQYTSKSKTNAEKMSLIIKSRLNDFKTHFEYLFNISDEFALNTRFIDVDDYKMILKGVCEYIFNEFSNSQYISLINPINVFIDNTSENRFKDTNRNNDILFEEFYNISNYKELVEMLGIKVPSKVRNNNEEEDVIKALKDKVNIFFNQNDNLFHITFLNFDQKPQFSINDFNKLNSSIANNGLLSDLTYTELGNSFVSGFGVNGLTSHSTLVNSAKLWNSFVSNNQNKRLNPFKKNEVIANNVISLSEQNLQPIFDTSNWVTFIDPSVDLSYFNDSEHELYVIHYNDQTSSFNYESITVTNNTSQYENVLKEFLAKVNVDFKPENMESIIRSFNILNGEWLLSIIGTRNSRSHNVDNKVREKLSIIAAYKTLLSLLDKSSITWIPVSLEEIIRVSRQQGLDASTDIFSAKELKHKGSISDDLLFIGFEINEENEGVFYLLPAEVKVGQNDSSVMNKASIQVSELYKVLNKQLINEDELSFTRDYYRLFFANIYFGNLKKFIDNGVIQDENKIEMLQHKTDVLNNKIHFSNTFNHTIAKGAAVFFTDGNSFRKVLKQPNSNILELHLTERDAYIDAEKGYEVLKEEIQSGKRGISLNLLEENTDYNRTENEDIEVREENESQYQIDDSESELKTTNQETGDSSEDVNGTIKNESMNDTFIPDQDNHEELENSEQINKVDGKRILLGNIHGSTEQSYWEYGDKGLPNRHLLISGKSGQGKTYFMQCLLYEMSKNKIDSLVVDYTDGFLIPQLEDEFVEKLQDHLKPIYIYKDKLPINPFKRNTIDLGGLVVEETNDDIADRVVQIVDFVFSLGIQQSSLLKEHIRSGLDIFDEDLTFGIIKQRLLDDESNHALTLHGRISNLLNKDPFAYKDNAFSWKDIFNFNGDVNIFQLKGYSPEIQKIITEFLLWDLYNFTEREGNKNYPIPVLLDEMQNLNHKTSSPTTKILKEGRKFGWSSWLATQSISSIKNAGGETDALYNAALQIHFAPPEDQIVSVSKTMATDKNTRQRIEEQLASLNKGQCLINGYALINNELKKVNEVVDITPLEER